MNKTVLAAASSEKQKYFIDPEFTGLPESIQEEIKVMCVLTAQKLFCTFVIGFEDSGDIYFDIVKNEGDIDFDDIGAELEVKKIKNEKNELIKALKIWYLIFKTESGEEVKSQLLKEKNAEK